VTLPATVGVCTHNKRYIDIPCFPEGNNSGAVCCRIEAAAIAVAAESGGGFFGESYAVAAAGGV